MYQVFRHWKVGITMPRGDQHDSVNYRPMCLTPRIKRIVERALHVHCENLCAFPIARLTNQCCALKISAPEPLGTYHIGGFLHKNVVQEKELGVITASNLKTTQDRLRKVAAANRMCCAKRSFSLMTLDILSRTPNHRVWFTGCLSTPKIGMYPD